jgi:hypothetical protein
MLQWRPQFLGETEKQYEQRRQAFAASARAYAAWAKAMLHQRHAAGSDQFLSCALPSPNVRMYGRFQPVLPPRVLRHMTAAWVAQSCLTKAAAGCRGTRAMALRGRRAAMRVLRAGRGVHRLRALEMAAMRAEYRPGRRFIRRTVRHVSWVTEGPKLKRAHRKTGRTMHRPKNDDASAKRAVERLQKIFRLDRRAAEGVVIPTMSGTRKPNGQRERSLRERLRKR